MQGNQNLAGLGFDTYSIAIDKEDKLIPPDEFRLQFEADRAEIDIVLRNPALRLIRLLPIKNKMDKVSNLPDIINELSPFQGSSG
jgi:hypothetical protein